MIRRYLARRKMRWAVQRIRLWPRSRKRTFLSGRRATRFMSKVWGREVSDAIETAHLLASLRGHDVS